MKFLKKLLIALIVLVVIIVGVGFVLPSEQHVERSTIIDASPSEIYQYLVDFRRFNEWSPWAELDPEGTQYEFSGPNSGVGATMSWASDDNRVGAGTQKILEANPYDRVRSELRFDGFDGVSYATFTLEPAAGGTQVTWGFDANLDNLVGRYMGLMMDKWVGADYERGLANLKNRAEQ